MTRLISNDPQDECDCEDGCWKCDPDHDDYDPDDTYDDGRWDHE